MILSFMLDVALILCFLCISIRFRSCLCADSSPVQDTCPTVIPGEEFPFMNGFPCKNSSSVMPSDFKTSELKDEGDIDNFLSSSMRVLSAGDLGGLNTQGISMGRTDLGVDGVVLPHSHPRASELLYVSSGVVLAGFIDTGNNVFQKRIEVGDVFVFPRGLLHFCLNAGFEMATLFSVFNSQNPGVMSIEGALFQPDTDEMMDRILRRSIKSRRSQ